MSSRCRPSLRPLRSATRSNPFARTVCAAPIVSPIAHVPFGAAKYSSSVVPRGDVKRQVALYFKKENDPVFSKVLMPIDGDVPELTGLIKAKLPSLKNIDPTTMVLRREDEKGELGPALGSRMTLEEAGVKDRDKVVVSVDMKRTLSLALFRWIERLLKVGPRLPALPAPMVFSSITLGGEPWFKADVVQRGMTAPIFLTPAQHKELLRFIDEPPSAYPQLFMPVGTFASGKSTVLHELLPGMVAARASSLAWPGYRRKPIIFKYKFPLMADAEQAAMGLSLALHTFGEGINIPFDMPADAAIALVGLPEKLETFAQHVKEAGGELWLLFDEMQGPLLNSTPNMAQKFTHQFKEIVERCSPFGRIALTGSGVATLLNAFRTARVNSFALWDAVSYLRLGSTPEPLAAQEIATRIHTAYTSRWPSDIKAVISAKMLVEKLSTAADNSLTSPRPALLAYTLQWMGDGSRGSADEILSAALAAVRAKLLMESVRDTAKALGDMEQEERRELRAVADGKYTHADLREIRFGSTNGDRRRISDGKLAHLIEHLSELGSGSTTVRLQPPYQALLRSWVCENGDLAVDIN
jgi:hypothetical protein